MGASIELGTSSAVTRCRAAASSNESSVNHPKQLCVHTDYAQPSRWLTVRATGPTMIKSNTLER